MKTIRVAFTLLIAFLLCLTGLSARAQERTVSDPIAIEYYHGAFDHYFITADPNEMVKLDNGVFTGWVRTGQVFSAYDDVTRNVNEVCRFFSTSFGPKSSHFYTASDAECAAVMRNRDWQFEGLVFKMALPNATGECADSAQPLYRVYNNGLGGAPNHRYTTSVAVRLQMLAMGWIAEGNGPDAVDMCSRRRAVPDEPPIHEPDDSVVILPPIDLKEPRKCDSPLVIVSQDPPQGEDDEQQTVSFNPALVMPSSIDTTNDQWLSKCNDSIESEEAKEDMGNLAEEINQDPEDALPDGIELFPHYAFPNLKPPPPPPNVSPGDVKQSCALPFCGRDVILVHGYRTTPLWDFLNGFAPAETTWPDNPAEFNPGGYWFEGARQYWTNYVINKLAPAYAKVAPGVRMPRVLFVAYPTTQRLEIASRAMLQQVSDAITNKANVYTFRKTASGLILERLDSSNDPFPTRPFCFLKCVVVSHSTGGPVTNVAMSLAYNYGMGIIPSAYIKAHVAIEPVFTGSNWATKLVTQGVQAAVQPIACAKFIATLTIGFPNQVNISPLTCLRIPGLIQSITLDDVPAVMSSLWHPVMSNTSSPVPTLIVATGHPTRLWFNMWNERQFPGFNDNTATMDSQLGRGWAYGFPHSNFMFVDQRRFVIDRANGGKWPLFSSSAKAMGYYIDQIHPPSIPFLTPASAAANPYLTPTGMHIPVFGPGTIPAKSVGLPNTYTFLQAAASHFFREEFGQNLVATKDWDNLSECYGSNPGSYDYYPAGPKKRVVNEESRAVMDSAVYIPDSDNIPLVSKSMQDAVVGETVTRWRGKKSRGNIRWRRTYYNLADYRCKDYIDYIHDFALRP